LHREIQRKEQIAVKPGEMGAAIPESRLLRTLPTVVLEHREM